ncbi:hypothetical protein WH50_25615 [Pokkaliibacter plantistimulans]|uniref:Uncharacterized protein n=1 Tax=Pokkaliibacter plantistimulans TaxID=1635171 RepID=A0ABX5LPS0_9GAMM|nr:hypothetical protein [Pokkaliibacter plantistimulans]PXF28572.1 hypothetical protein WH50_25615 [Pokkaliibacter plantistimulans]
MDWSDSCIALDVLFAGIDAAPIPTGFLLVTSPPVMGGVGRNGLLMPEYQHAAAAPGMAEAAGECRYSGDSAGKMADNLAVIYRLLLFPFGWA